jgi:hypothetical protein
MSLTLKDGVDSVLREALYEPQGLLGVQAHTENFRELDEGEGRISLYGLPDDTDTSVGFFQNAQHEELSVSTCAHAVGGPEVLHVVSCSHRNVVEVAHRIVWSGARGIVDSFEALYDGGTGLLRKLVFNEYIDDDSAAHPDHVFDMSQLTQLVVTGQAAVFPGDSVQELGLTYVPSRISRMHANELAVWAEAIDRDGAIKGVRLSVFPHSLGRMALEHHTFDAMPLRLDVSLLQTMVQQHVARVVASTVL